MSLNMSGARVTNNLLAQFAVRSINRNTRQMLDLQSQMASGLRLYKPSIDPAAATVSLSLQTLVERREQGAANISRSSAFLAASDKALADLQDLLNEAASIASTNIGAGSDSQTRQNAATVVASLIDQLAQIGNRQYEGRYLFAGRATDRAPFSLSDSMVRFVGDNSPLYAALDSTSSVPYNLTAAEAFGTLSGSVASLDDLDPDITLATRLRELNAGRGVRAGSLILSDGVTSTVLDLSGCDTVLDVINAINSNGVVSVTASINAAGNGLLIQGDPGDTISVNDLSGGYVARDLGILQATPLAPGANLVGADLDRQLTLLTELTALRAGLGIDTASGLRLSVGADTVDIDLSAAQTVQDLLNVINYGGIYVNASISADGRRLIVANTVASQSMAIGENGGSTATDLGIRTMAAQTLLADLNDGQGVRTVAGLPDFRIVTRDGSTIDVNVSGIASLADLIAAINAHPDNAGRVVAAFNLVGNGIRLTDATAGAADFRVLRLNGSAAAQDLGIEKSVANPAAVINGDDVAPVVEHGAFQRFYALRDALLREDNAAISRAGAAIQDEIARVARIRGTLGSRMRLLDVSKQRMQDEVLQVKALLSEVRDLDYADAIARFKTLEATFQASLQTAASVLPVTLMDFISL